MTNANLAPCLLAMGCAALAAIDSCAGSWGWFVRLCVAGNLELVTDCVLNSFAVRVRVEG